MAIKERVMPKDIHNMSVEEITAYLQERKVHEARDRHERAIKAKGELEQYCQEKYGLTLAQVFTASDKMPTQKQYKHPGDGSLYVYSGKGKVPGWLKGSDGKPNPAYEVKAS